MEMYDIPHRRIEHYEKIREKEDWGALSAVISLDEENLPVTFAAYYDAVPDEHRYDFLIDLYMHGGDRVPAIRREIRKLNRYGAAKLPEEFDGQDEITVYRAGDEPVSKAPYRLSWTTDRSFAEWFMGYSGTRKGCAMHLYKAVIKRGKVLAYTDMREEKEVLQYRGVRNVEEIGSMTYEEAVKKYAEGRGKGDKAG